MSAAAASVKLSPAIKQLISAPHARGEAIPAPSPRVLGALFQAISQRGQKGRVGADTWLTLSTGALVTINSPESLCGLYDYAAKGQSMEEASRSVAIIRETALKCISFSGIPRTINALTALRSHIPKDTASHLGTTECRLPKADNLKSSLERGRALWDSIYEPHSTKLLNKLGDAHPDLPVHILASHYAYLLSDPFLHHLPGGSKIGRVLTSVVAIAALRAQQGVAPQLTSHVFGLKKSLLEGGGADGEPAVQGQDWLTSDEGIEWVLQSTDEITEVVGQGRPTFAGDVTRSKAKL